MRKFFNWGIIGITVFFTTIFFLLSFSYSGAENVQAKVVTSDQGVPIDIPDKYFIKTAPTQEEISEKKADQKKMLYYVDHPHEHMTGKLDWDYVGYDTMYDVAKMFYDKNVVDGIHPYKSIDNTLAYIRNQFEGDPSEIIMREDFGGLDTDNFQVQPGMGYFSILKPSDITVYNETNQDNIEQALQYTFNQWEKIPNIHFRFVDNKKDARLIVARPDQLRVRNANTTKSDSFYRTDYSYQGCLIQGTIIVSKNTAKLPANSTTLKHLLVHEFGHVFGLDDMF